MPSYMPSIYKKFACMLLTASMAATVVAMPLRVTLKGWGAELSVQSAFAKDGNGKGGGQGKGGSKGNGNAKSGGNGKGKDASGRSAAKNPATQHVNPITGDLVQVSGTNIEVLHRNGMRERVKAGRYLMKDASGRIIIERRATGADVSRLHHMMD